ncbi:MAG: hypothetical protein EOP88_14125 [Verrucomicrobiaceae bacterium]|nr:MAG: hypothetical protein EOP88_14125 [Verrucomicrobiaceae bacterium]
MHHISYTIHHIPYTIHHTPYTSYHTPYTLHPTPYTLHPTPYTLHHTSYFILYTPNTFINQRSNRQIHSSGAPRGQQHVVLVYFVARGGVRDRHGLAGCWRAYRWYIAIRCA